MCVCVYILGVTAVAAVGASYCRNFMR